MIKIITDFSTAFVKLTIWQKDGSRLEITFLGKKGVLYWARTKNGKVLFGFDRDGLEKIQAVLAGLEAEEAAALYYALQDLKEAGFESLEVTVALTDKGHSFTIVHRDVAADLSIYDSFDDASAFTAAKRGYSQPK